MPVFLRLRDRGVEGFEEEEGQSINERLESSRVRLMQRGNYYWKVEEHDYEARTAVQFLYQTVRVSMDW